MEQCECFRLATNYHKDYCAGTKECEPCSCKGDPSKCDFYEDVRRKAVGKMNTAEMYIEANELVDDTIVFYTPGRGFKYSVQGGFGIEGQSITPEEFMSLEWERDNRRYMTKSEAEAKFNIKIVG